MSEPKNPFASVSTYSVTYILSAWPDTISAENDSNAPKLNDQPEGKSLPGNGILILNDYFGDENTNQTVKRFVAKRLEYHHSWAGLSTNHTTTVGEFLLSDVSGGDFLTFLRNEVVGVLKVSLENITFRLDIFFHLPQRENTEEGPVKRIEPILFNVVDISQTYMNMMHMYSMKFVSTHNTTANNTKFTRMYDMTVTHKEGRLHGEIPKPKASGGDIMPRGSEDKAKNQARVERINKSKPMTTLKDAFEALQVELNESTKIHKNQLQGWQAIIRDDFVFKLDSPSIQRKKLDIKFTIHLDPEYNEYQIDNRVLPLEQPEGDGKIGGIRAIPCRSGEPIDNLIDRIMKMSRQSGIDASKGFSYKICSVWRKQGDQLLYDIVIKKYEVPVNEMGGKNTGPGESAKDPLTYFYHAGPNRDTFVVKGKAQRTDRLALVEDIIDVLPGRTTYGEGREAITAEREVEKPLFESGFSGFRAKVGNHKTLGVEYPRELGETMKKQYRMQSLQQSVFAISIVGNPDLFSDTVRKPSEVAAREHPKAVYYQFPELLPWYMKLKMYHSSSGNIEVESIGDRYFYHTEWMHVMKISSVIDASMFTQTITLARSDGFI